MKKDYRKKSAPAPTVKKTGLALTTTNYVIFAMAVVVLIIGYYFLSIGPANSVQSLTIAPIILVIGYVVLVPLAIFWRKKKSSPTTGD